MAKQEMRKKNYKVILFTLEGHRTWRLSQDVKMTGIDPTKITAMKTIEVDIFSGEIKVETVDLN